MIISGAFILTKKGEASRIATIVNNFPGVEVHHIDIEAKIIITVEAATIEDCYHIAEKIEKVNGVLNFSVVYITHDDGALITTGDVV
ncbi:nitrate reductase NapD [Evansella caseinilytica]|uniref:Nitrate reductase NapD n=1 Tax=Evansella caseinilytica TaxID=1503961 RepID=A0A1H3SI87_9BACI|nr:chaperone NapD [Evansella caseinilytica]SDZ37410.1 nitrate reductase NapD [Evansella caseinilytica]